MGTRLKTKGYQGIPSWHRGLDPLPRIHRRELTAGHSLAWAAFRTCTTTGSLLFLGNVHSKYILSDVLVQESDIF